jgi:gliding motility-associated-like protein
MTNLLSKPWQLACCAWLWLAQAAPVQAQREYFNWYFGDSAALSFVAPTPQVRVLLDGHVKFPQGVASMSDGAGQLQFTSDGYRVWDRRGRLLPGANVPQTLRNYGINARQTIALPAPGSASRYYVFVSQREFYLNEYPVSQATALYLPYVVVDMSLRGGLGGLTLRDSLRLPDAALHIQAPLSGLAGNWAAVRHANGRDIWLVGVSNEGQYLSWLLTAAGLARTPVISSTPRWVSSGNTIFKAAPDGRTLALLANARDDQSTNRRVVGRIELSDFDAATGQVSNLQQLPTRFKGTGWYMNGNSGGGTLSRLAGLEFSPDGARLYADSAGAYPLQYNLLAGSLQGIDASRTQIRPVGSNPSFTGSLTDMKLGPDGRIYCAYGSTSVSCITVPNALGQACQLQAGALSLQGRSASTGTLPLSVNDLNLPPVVVSSAGSIAAGGGCAGTLIQFMSSLSPFVTAASYDWDFGDPSAGTLNHSGGQAPGHIYQQGGTYTVTLRVTAINGQQYTTTQPVQILASPQATLGPTVRMVCQGQTVVLNPGAQPAGTTLTWQDGSTQPTFTARQPGVYTVRATNALGCSTTASTRVEWLPTSSAFLGNDTTICLETPYQLRPRGLQLPGTTYRWQDGSTGASLLVAQPGRYELETTSANGCAERAAVVVSNGNCPLVLPNIITPNGDSQNEYFVIKNLTTSNWQLDIYNRWGRQVYQKRGYDNSWNASGQPKGIYFYLLRNAVTGEQHKGQLEVLR